MSDHEHYTISDSTDGDDEILKDFHNVNSRFQERLLEAQHDALEKQIVSEMEKTNHQDEEDPHNTASEIAHLEQMILKTQREVNTLEYELKSWRRKRHMEATTTLLTPEERAAQVEQEQDAMNSNAPTSDLPLTRADVDSIFDYLFELGRAPPPQTAAELENTTTFGLMGPNEDMKRKIFEHPDIIEQQKFTHLTFTEMDNTFVEHEDDDYRECKLAGKAYDTPFSVSFRVSALNVSNLEFDVPVDLKVDGNALLSKIKDEDNLHLFFRLIQHYGRLEFDKVRTFDHLMEHYRLTDVRVINKEPNCLIFETKWDDLQLSLTWQYAAKEIRYEKLDVNICEQFMPRVRLTVISEWRSAQFDAVMSGVPAKFDALAQSHGVISATTMMVGLILQEPHQEKKKELLL